MTEWEIMYITCKKIIVEIRLARKEIKYTFTIKYVCVVYRYTEQLKIKLLFSVMYYSVYLYAAINQCLNKQTPLIYPISV